MTGPLELTLTETAWAGISRHAVDAFPEECCGVILDHRGHDEVRRLTNIQSQLHALDPKSYPRDATIAYATDFRELGAIIREAEAAGANIKAFYHSHPNHKAYFSEEDKAAVIALAEPPYPEAAQVVISIYHRVVKEIRAYAWKMPDFVEIPLKKI